jgi:hypothetical protein
VQNKGKGVADGKQKERKNQVRWGASMPFRMLQWLEHGVPRPRIIDQDHQSDCCATEYIEGQKTLFVCFFHEILRFRKAAVKTNPRARLNAELCRRSEVPDMPKIAAERNFAPKSRIVLQDRFVDTLMRPTTMEFRLLL